MKNRIIKFRVWDKTEKKFWNTDDGLYFWLHSKSAKELGGVSISFFIGRFEQFVVQQFTGLKDKNGKEIYEGDIIRNNYKSEYIPKIAEVVWHRNGFIANICDSAMFSLSFTQQMIDGDLEIVGNILKNPELLNK